MKTTVATLSVLNIAAGLGLVVVYTVETSPPLLLLALGVALLTQGGFTLAYILGAFEAHAGAALHLQLVGSTLALIVGTIGFMVGLLGNINPVNNDPEYGPMTIAVLIAGHGFASLLAHTPHRPLKGQTPTI
jgi:uncharacterized membrane protein HdeD (DUF308 family)